MGGLGNTYTRLPPGRVHLVGGGWSEEHYPSVYGPFVREALQVARLRSRPAARVGLIQLFDSAVETRRSRARSPDS